MLQEILEGTDADEFTFATMDSQSVHMILQLMLAGYSDEGLKLLQLDDDPRAMKELPTWMQNALVNYAKRWFDACDRVVTKREYATRESIDAWRASVDADPRARGETYWRAARTHLGLLELDLERVFPGGLR